MLVESLIKETVQLQGFRVMAVEKVKRLIMFAVMLLIVVGSLSIMLWCASCGDSSTVDNRASSTTSTVSASVKARLDMASRYGVSDRELIVLFHPEILPYTISEENGNGQPLSPEEYENRIGDEVAYYYGLYKIMHPSPANSPTYDVTSIVDGDTFNVMINGQEQAVRLIGLSNPKKCGSQDATDWLTKRISGEKVVLETDPTIEDKDQSGHLMRYGWLNERDIGLDMLGANKTYINEKQSFKYQSLYQRVQGLEKGTSQTPGEGVWDPKGCNGQG